MWTRTEPSCWRSLRARSARDRADAVVIDALLATAGTPEGMYGRLKMVPYPRNQGLTVSARHVDRLMRVLGMRIRGGGTRTTMSDKNATRAPQPLDRDFTAPAPNRRWLANSTYVRARAGFAYVSFAVP
jgi:putative transposase